MERVISFDVGQKTLGIAISDVLGITVRGLETYRFADYDYDQAVKRAIEILERENVNKIIIGLPLNMNGSESSMSKKVLIFKEKLKKIRPLLDIIMVDERLSTVAAQRNLIEMNLKTKKRKKIIDMEAAAIILEMYLEKIKNNK
ncbi:MAG: Holliday junction resolvase RuvX [Bacilli bacterium]|nr:Holliday junction resolvase RuvX [Bacilli bacterium]